MDEDEPEEVESDLNIEAAAEYSSQLRRMSVTNELHEIKLPPPPPGQPDVMGFITRRNQLHAN